MGVISKCGNLIALLVAVVAVGVGLLFTDVPEQAGFYSYLDNKVDARGNLRLRGIAPALTSPEEWGFTLEQLSSTSLSGQTFVVTGANVGLGYWTAHHLAGAGGHVVMTCRTQSKCDAAIARILTAHPSASLEAVLMDLASFNSVLGAAKTITGKHPRINSLILNAGVMRCPFTLTHDGLEMQIGTNHFGHYLFTKAVHGPVVSAAQAGENASIVVVASSAHFNSYPEGVRLSLEQLNDEASYKAGDAYGQSKLANVLFAQELSSVLSRHGVLVNAVHPGAVATELGRHIVDKDSVPGKLLGAIISKMLWHPREAALTQLYAAVGPRLFEERTNGKYFHPIARVTKPDPHTFNASLQKGLWELSEEVVASKLGDEQPPAWL